MASRKKEFMRDRAFSVPTTSTINDNQLNETSQQASHPKKKRKSETMVLRENQENMRTNSYYDDDQFGIVTRSRRRRFTTDTCLAFDKKKLTKNNKKNSKKTPLKSKAIAKKSPEEKKPKKKQLQENAGENEFDSLLANLRNGVENMSASTSTSIKEKLYEISTFPACGNFIKINNGITYCKLARNAGIGYMKPESIRPWVSLKAREFANYFVIKGKLTVSFGCKNKSESLEIGPFSLLKLQPLSRFQMTNKSESETVFLMTGFVSDINP